MQPRWILVAGSGLCVYAGAVYSTLLFMKGRQGDSDSSSNQCTCTHDRCRYDALAPIYDSAIGWDEFLMGMPLIRWAQVSKARGQVLEVSAGTGRNFGCYSSDVDHVVFSDVSFDMLRLAKLKWEASQHQYTASFMLSDVESLAGNTERERASDPRQGAATGITAYLKHLWGLRVSRYASSRPAGGAASPPDNAPAPQPRSEQAAGLTERVVVDSEESLRSAVLAPGRGHCFEGRLFDCVVDTFGLCSCKDPVRALQEMLKVLRPGGRLILLEHGRGTWSYFNDRLDADAQRHYAKWGCYWNLDMLALVREAGLEVEAVSRWHFGTTYCIVARSSWRNSTEPEAGSTQGAGGAARSGPEAVSGAGLGTPA